MSTQPPQPLVAKVALLPRTQRAHAVCHVHSASAALHKVRSLTRAETYRRRVQRRADFVLSLPPGRIQDARRAVGMECAVRAPEELPVQLQATPTSEDGRLAAWGLLRGGQRLGVFQGGTARCACEAIPRELDEVGGLYAAYGSEKRGENPSWHVRTSGLKMCESLNCCPVCARTRGLEWAARIARWAGLHLADGGALYLVTLTLPHRRGQRLAGLHEWMKRAWALWRKADGGGVWDPRAGLPEIMWYVRGQEETYGANGWHTHLHLLIALPKWLEGTSLTGYSDGDPLLRRHERGDQDPAARWAGELVRRWIAALDATKPDKGAGAALSRAQDVRAVPALDGVERYLVKLGLEVSAQHAKAARSSEGRTPFAILGDLISFGAELDLALWREYVEVMGRAKRISTSARASHPDRIYDGREWEPPPERAAPPALEWRQLMPLPQEGLAGLVASRCDVVLREWARQDGLEVHRLELLTRYHAELLGPHHEERGWVGLWRDVTRDLVGGVDPPAWARRRLAPAEWSDAELDGPGRSWGQCAAPPLDLLDALGAPEMVLYFQP